MNNIEVLNNTLDIMNNGFYKKGFNKVPLKLNSEQMKFSKVFLPNDVAAIDLTDCFTVNRTEITCENIDTLSMAQKITEKYNLERDIKKPVLVLNFANGEFPGGAVRAGARAQEEDLCRKSSLLLALESKYTKPYYDYNNKNYSIFGANDAAVQPFVEVIKDKNASLLDDSYIISVITCAAPVCNYTEETKLIYAKAVYSRIETIFKIAAYMSYEHLVLGAFGCGMFGNDAKFIAEAFDYMLKHYPFFNSVNFAVLDNSVTKYNYKSFSAKFSNSFLNY